MSGKVAVTDDSINVSNFNVRTGETALWADGAVAQYKQTPTLAMHISFTPLSLPEIRRFVPSMKEMNVAPTINVKLGGPTTRLAAEVSAKSNAGDFAFKGTVSLGGPRSRVLGRRRGPSSGSGAVPQQSGAEERHRRLREDGRPRTCGLRYAARQRLRGRAARLDARLRRPGYPRQRENRRPQDQLRHVRAGVPVEHDAAGSVEFATDERPETRFDLRGRSKTSASRTCRSRRASRRPKPSSRRAIT